MSTATLTGVELYYEIMGTGPTLFLTHGSWTDGSSWAQLAELLADRYEVVTWDRRGHSRSADTDEPGSRTEDATDRKSTRLNSSHVAISYAVFCLKKTTRKPMPYEQLVQQGSSR